MPAVPVEVLVFRKSRIILYDIRMYDVYHVVPDTGEPRGYMYIYIQYIYVYSYRSSSSCPGKAAGGWVADTPVDYLVPAIYYMYVCMMSCA